MLLGKHLNKYYLRYAIFFIIGIIALVLVDIAQLQVPSRLGTIVDIFEEVNKFGIGFFDDQKQIVTKVAIEMVVLAAIMLAGRILWRYTIFYASNKIESKIRHEMFLKAERLPVDYYHQNKVGNIMSWFTNDIDMVQEYLGWGTIMLVDSAFLTVLTVIFMIKCCWQLAIISFIPILLIVVWGLISEKAIGKLWGLHQSTYDELYDYSQESFTGIRVIKAFVKETQQVYSFAKIAKKNQEINYKFAVAEIGFEILLTIIINLIVAIIFGFGGWFAYTTISSGSISIFGQSIEFKTSTLVEFLTYFETLIWPMIALGQVVVMKSRAKESLRRISCFLDAEEDVKNPENPIVLEQIEGNITFNNFSYTYPGQKEPSVKNISLEIKAGETIGVVGKIGCGKTTLINSLLRLTNIEPNSILLDGNDLMSCDIQSIRENIAYVPQDNFLFSDTIRNNIAFSNMNMEMDDVIAGAKFSDVHKDIEEFADKYETVSGERGVTLSGGQKQRISIARAFAKNAPIMILDDSVSAVDVKTEEMILHNINEYRKGKTTILVASRVSTVSHLDKILVLKDGEIEAFGDHKTLVKTSKTYQSMVLLQELEKEKGGIL